MKLMPEVKFEQRGTDVPGLPRIHPILQQFIASTEMTCTAQEDFCALRKGRRRSLDKFKFLIQIACELGWRHFSEMQLLVCIERLLH